MSTIALKNPRLRNYIRRVLQVDRYGEPYSTLVVEVFVREQQVLDLTPEEFNEDLINFARTINTFRFEQMEEKNVLGYQFKDEIVFNYDYWNNIAQNSSPEMYAKSFFETFAHECLHGMQSEGDSRGRSHNRAGGYNKRVKNRSHAIYEIGTQAIAAKMTHDRTSYDLDNDIILSGDGYSDEIFAIPLIASTFGISEKEVLKYSVRPRNELVKVLNKNIGNMEKTEDLVQKLEDELEYFHSISYPDDNQKKFKNMNEGQKKKAKTECILKLVNICQEAFATRIKNTPLDLDKDMIIQYKSDQKKMINTLSQEFNLYGYEFKKDYNELFNQAITYGEDASYIRDAIDIFNQIGKDKTGNLTRIAPYLIDAVKKEDFDYCERNGVEVLSNLTFSLVDNALDFKDKKSHEDYNDFRAWDNSEIYRAISPNIIVTEKVANINPLNVWNSYNLNSYEAYQKKLALKHVLQGNKKKYNIDSSNILFEYLETPSWEMNGIFNRFTKENGVRDTFISSFSQESDKELVAKLMAEKYIDKLYDFDNYTLRDVSDSKDIELQRAFLDTVNNYGKDQLIQAIAQGIVNDDYQYFSGEDAKDRISIIGKRSLFDAVSKPLIQELLEQREISPEKVQALQKSIAATETKYPGSMAFRIGKIISEYRNTGNIKYNIITTNGRAELMENFKTNKDMEDLVGILCDNFSRYVDSNESFDVSADEHLQFLSQMVKYQKPDNFRENMIKTILYRDTSGFNNIAYDQYFQSMPLDRLISTISYPTIENSKAIEHINEVNGNYVTKDQLKSNVGKRKLSVFKKITDMLLNMKNKIRDTIVRDDDRSGE